jgi:Recombination endonuclease VII
MMRGIKNKAACHADRKHYAHGMCRQCYGQTRKQHNAAYRDIHKEEIAVRTREWYEKNSEKVNLSVRNRRLAVAGWTQEMYQERFEEQKGRCAICGTAEARRRLAADHEHTYPPNPRGLLCGLCNRAIGYLKDNPTLLRKAADYIEHYSTKLR